MRQLFISIVFLIAASAQYSPPGGGGGASFPSGTGTAASHSGSGALATPHDIALPLGCAAASNSATAYTCSTSPTFVPAAKDLINFCPDLANTGAATLVVNGQSGTPAIQKQQGQAALAANDLRASPACVMLQFNGTNWVMDGQLGNASSTGGATLIASTTLVTAAPSMAFIAIPGTYTHLRILFEGRSSASAQSENLNLTVNGDSGTNYNFEQMSATGSGTASANTNSGVATPFIAAIPGASATAGSAAMATIDIPGYAQTTFWKAFISHFGWTDTSANPNHVQTLWVQWKNTSAITSITLTEGSGANLVAGSTASLYGFQ